jgi:formylglycine-generating enzyme required for sulfatase activity
MITAVSG